MRSEQIRLLPIRREFVLVGIGIVVALFYAALLIGLRRTPLLQLELLVYDWGMGAIPHRLPDRRIVLVGMDDGSLSHLPHLERQSYPLPRAYHAVVIDNLRRAGAKVIGWDVMFTGSQTEDDPVFLRAIERYGKVVAGARPDVKLENGIETVHFTDSTLRLDAVLQETSLLVRERLGRVRSIDPYPVDTVTGKRYTHLSLTLAALFRNGRPENPLSVRDNLHWGKIDAPLTDDEEVLIRYIGRKDTFKYVPYYEVYNNTWMRRRPADFFRDKIVLIGAVQKLEDRHDTPLGEMAGVEVQMNALQMFLTDDYIYAAPIWANGLLGLLLIAVFLIAVGWRGLGIGLGSALLLGIGWTFGAHLLFVTHRYWMDTVAPLGALTVAVLPTAIYETQRTRRVFERFMPSWVASRALAGQTEHSALAEKEVTVVFCDLRNYTALSERLSPAAADNLQKEYFRAAENGARRFGTEIDKYIGDGVMLYFLDRRRGDEPHALRAVRWALAMQIFAERVDASGRAGATGFRIGIGIATGTAREGFVGTDRMQSTVVGDVVNTASRLQEATKTLGKPIAMTLSTFSQVANYVQAEPLGSVNVRGKREPMPVFYPLRIVETTEPIEETK